MIATVTCEMDVLAYQQGNTEVFPSIYQAVEPYMVGLVNKYTSNQLVRNHHDYRSLKEEFFQEANVGLLLAIRSYHEDKAIPFTRFASVVIGNHLGMIVRKMYVRKASLQNLSLEQPIATDKDGDEQTLAEILADTPAMCVATRVVYEEELRIFQETAKDLDIQVFSYLQQEYKQSEIMKLLGLGQSSVSRRITRILRTYFSKTAEALGVSPSRPRRMQVTIKQK